MNELALYVYEEWDRKIGLTSEELIYGSLEMFREQTGDSLSTRPVLERTSSGKPYFFHSHIGFSLSHSGPYWVCLMGKRNGGLSLGVDVQVHTDYHLALPKRFFTTGEQRYIVGSGASDPESDLEEKKRFFALWTRKEAITKYLDQPLLKTFREVDLAPAGALLDHYEGIVLQEIDLGKGATCTCAYEDGTVSTDALKICHLQGDLLWKTK